MTPAIQTRGLSKRYRKVAALSDATITVPEGRISALIGPNGAGKTTLLRLLAGLARPTGGEVTVLGMPRSDDRAFLAGIGFLAQEIPLYRRFTAEDHIRIGAHLNSCWDAESVQDRLQSLSIPRDQRVGTLSGGQRAQLALALTLAARPKAIPGSRAADTHDRVRADRIDDTGTVTLRHAGQLYHIGIGRTHARTHVLLLVQDLHIRIINAATGELLRDLTLDPSRNYQPTGRPPRPTPRTPRKRKHPEP
jgi:ABC-type lipoprotein export system ATPase subunit